MDAKGFGEKLVFLPRSVTVAQEILAILQRPEKHRKKPHVSLAISEPWWNLTHPSRKTCFQASVSSALRCSSDISRCPPRSRSADLPRTPVRQQTLIIHVIRTNRIL